MSRVVPNSCPAKSVLREFNEGRIPSDSEIDRITEHLGECETCIETLEDMSPGAIEQGLRAAQSDFTGIDDTQMLASLEVQSHVDSAYQQVRDNPLDPWVDPSEFGETKFQLVAVIGEGEFSSVYGAIGADKKTLLGIKIPHSKKLTSRRHNEQFFSDCRAAQSLDHPGIQPVLEFGKWDESRIFLSKPLIQHSTLTAFARSGVTLQRSEVAQIFRRIVVPIQFAHSQSVLHRHLSPNNIHVIMPGENKTDSDEFKIIVSDFGFVLDSRYHFDLIEPLESKDPFTSPESATLNAQYVDERSDVFSLGKILKLLLRVAEPSAGEAQANQSSLDQVVAKSTSLRRRDRFQTVDEMLKFFDQI